MNNAFSHCCELMSQFLADEPVPIEYNPKFREYYLLLFHQDACQGILFCPWCGEKLPERLGDKYFEILKNEYGITHPNRKDQKDLVPEEFKTDEWWKKRGL